jgi:hypothetical protein
MMTKRIVGIKKAFGRADRLLIGQQAHDPVAVLQRTLKSRGRRERLMLGIGIGEEQPRSSSNSRTLRERPRLANPAVGKLLAGDDL